MAQLICRYRKGEEVRWISHLDVKRTLERAMRRAQLPLSLTQGHNPHPKLSLGPPLSVGITGEAELIAIHLDSAMDPDALKQRLNDQLPPGLQVVEAWSVPAYRKKETFGDIDVAEYRVRVRRGPSAEALGARIADLMAAQDLPVARGEQGERTVDIRPLIISLQASDLADRELELHMRLRTGSHGGARPQEIVALLGLADQETQVCYHRTGVYASAQPPGPPAPRARRRWSGNRGRREGSAPS